MSEIKKMEFNFVDVETTGLSPDNLEIDDIIHQINTHRQFIFRGFLSHAGHTYSAKGKSEIISIMEESQTILEKLKRKYIKQFPDIIISYGDTPSCSMANNCNGFD